MKNKTLLLAKMSIRSEAVGGGAVPDDEMQCDFVISTNDEDSHCSIMTERTLENYAKDAERGVPFMLNHEDDMKMQIGRTIAASYDAEKKQTAATVSLLRDTEETPDNMKVNEYIRRIERGYYDSVSVGFRDATELCNIKDCGREIFDFYAENPCPHIPGRSYGGEKCTYSVDNARLRELSLVPSGSNPNAKLLDTREWEEDLRKVKKEGDLGTGNTDPKTLLERDGLKYREGIINEAIKSGIRAKDDFDEEAWRSRFAEMEASHIQSQKEDWDTIGDARWGEGGRVTDPGTGNPTETRSSNLWLPDNLFIPY